jgi:predicted transcriptional regulator
MMPEPTCPKPTPAQSILQGFSEQVWKVNQGDLATCMRRLREQHSCSLRKMAVKLGVSAPYLSDLELGRRNWSEKRIKSFLQALGISDEAYVSVQGNRWLGTLH